MASASTCEARRWRERGTPFSSSRRAERLADEAAWDDTGIAAVEAMEGAAMVQAVEGATVVEAVQGAAVEPIAAAAAEAEARVSAVAEEPIRLSTEKNLLQPGCSISFAALTAWLPRRMSLIASFFVKHVAAEQVKPKKE
jgi:hypothetical protein